MDQRGPFCPNGGLTLIRSGFEDIAHRIRILSGQVASQAQKTPVDILFRFNRYVNGETFIVLPNTHILEHDCIVIGAAGNDEMLMRLLDALHARRTTPGASRS